MFKCAESIILGKPPSVLRLVPSVLVPSLSIHLRLFSLLPQEKKKHYQHAVVAVKEFYEDGHGIESFKNGGARL